MYSDCNEGLVWCDGVMFGHAILMHCDGTLQSIFVPIKLEDAMSMIYEYFSQPKDSFNRVPRIVIDNFDETQTWLCFVPSSINIQNMMATDFLGMCGHDQICYCNMVLFDVYENQVQVHNGFHNIHSKLRRVIDMSRLQKAQEVENDTRVNNDLKLENDDFKSDEWVGNQSFDTWTSLLVDL